MLLVSVCVLRLCVLFIVLVVLVYGPMWSDSNK